MSALGQNQPSVGVRRDLQLFRRARVRFAPEAVVPEPMQRHWSTTMTHKQPGLDGRHRDNNGEIHEKRGDTKLGTLRQTYPGLLENRRSDVRPETLLFSKATGHI